MAENEYGKRPMWQWVLMYLLIGGAAYALFYYFVLAKGNTEMYTAPGTGDAMMEEGAPSPEAMMGDKKTVFLVEENESGQSGSATLEEVNGKVSVTLSMTGFPEDGAPQPAHIHIGECPGVGDVKYPLSSVVNGASVSSLDTTLEQLMGELPLAINIHKSAAEAKVYTACGQIN